MATFNTVWSLDVGRSSLKAVKLRRERNNIEILAIDKIDYKPGENGVDFASKAKEAINAFRIRNDVKEPIVVAHNGQGTLSRFIKIPAFDEKKVKEMVGYEASQQIPFPLDEVIWDYHVIEKDYMPGEEREVGLFAARRETIDDYLLDFTNEHLQVEGLTIGYLGLLNYIFYDINPQEPAIVLDIGGSHTDLILLEGRKFWLRPLPFSGNDINKAMMAKLRLSFDEAEKLKVDIVKNQEQAAKLFAGVIQPKLKELVNQIHQSIGYYRTQVGETQFKTCYLLGNGSRIIGIKKFIEEHLGVQVQRISTINHLRISRDVDLQMLQGNLPSFGTAFGAALQGVGAGACRVDLIPHEEKLHKEYERKKVHVFVAIGIVFVAAALSGFLLRNKVDNAGFEADAAAALLAPIEKIDRDIGRIQITDIEAQRDALTSVAELRAKPFQGLALLNDVLSALKPDEVIIESRQLRDDGSKDQDFLSDLKTRADDLLNKKVLIAKLGIRKVEWPEAAEKGGAPGALAKDKPPTVLAYKMSIFAVVAQQSSQEASFRLIQERVKTPLEAKLREHKASLDAKVTESAATESDLPTPVPKSSSGKRSEQQAYEDGPFYGVELSWFMRIKEPPAKKEEPKKGEREKKEAKPKTKPKKNEETNGNP
jgi:type IV pilus assembly protein PilM